MKSLIVVTGMHRSGTTFPGKILKTINDVLYVHEPFNPLFGCVDVASVYPYAGEERNECDARIGKIIDDIIRLRCKYKTNAVSDTFSKGVARRLLGGRGGIALLQAKAKSLVVDKNGANVLIKDPFAFLLTPLLVRHYNAKVIIMVRHPVAVWNSIKRMDWKFRFENFANPFFFQLEENRQYNKVLLDQMEEIGKIGHLWVILYRQALLYESRYRPNLMIVRHEDLCQDPVAVMHAMTQFMELVSPDNVTAKIRKFTQHDKIHARPHRLHDFYRNSRELAWSWCRKEKTAEENELESITGELVNELYGQWRPQKEMCRQNGA